MQLINAPGKLVLPFATSGAKNTIPVASQIGIVAGAASLTDGFPPLTRTPLAAGGTPPSGLDMNGIIYELSAILRWANAGGGYIYDGTFAADSNVGGYPKGARVLRSDGVGYWLNTADNNVTDPEGAGAVAAGWVPDFTNGVAAVTMTGSNVTLTALQYGKPIIVISGLLTASLNLIFPSIAGEWTVINNTTGAFSVTCKTAAGTGVVVNSAQAIVGDGTNIYSAVNDAISLLGENVAHAAGTADALTAAFTPAPHFWPDGVPFFVRAASANATTTPTFTPNSGTLTAKTIVKGANGALVAGDIAGAGHWLVLQYDATLDEVVLLNPATGIAAISGTPPVVGSTRNALMQVSTASASATFTADEVVVAAALGGTTYRLAIYSQVINLATTGAGGMDTGAAPASGFVSLYAIAKADGTKNILACAVATSTDSVYSGANMPVNYVTSALIGIWPTNGSSQFIPGRIADPLGRKFQYQTYPAIFTGRAQISTYTSQSVSAAVPAAAKYFSTLFTGTYVGGILFGASADATGTGAKTVAAYGQTGPVVMPGGAASDNCGAILTDCPLITPQTAYMIAYQVGGSSVIAMYISDFSW